jgi:hypothetical protein
MIRCSFVLVAFSTGIIFAIYMSILLNESLVLDDKKIIHGLKQRSVSFEYLET